MRESKLEQGHQWPCFYVLLINNQAFNNRRDNVFDFETSYCYNLTVISKYYINLCC
jgi:hypothetical protein